MNSRNVSWLAWSLWGLSVGAVALSTPLAVLNGIEAGSEWMFSAVTAPALASVGAIVASRRPENAVGWIFCIIGLASGVLVFTKEYAIYGLFTEPGSLPAAGAVIENTFFLAGLQFGLLITFALLLFPNGHLPSRWWLPVAWMCALGIVLMTVGGGLGAVQIGGRELVVRLIQGAEIIPSEGSGLASKLDGIGHNLVFLGLGAALVSLFFRWWRADQTQRQQIKWFAYAAAMFALVIFFSDYFPWPDWISLVLELATTAFIPVAVGIAILRYRLYDIDVIINRTLVYGLLSATLAGIYFGSVILIQMAFRATTGQENAIAIVISTLAIAALFMPLRRGIQTVIDRRFYRRKYDAEQTLAAFSARMRDEVDLDSLKDELVAAVEQTMQPAQVSLWLRTASDSGQQNGLRRNAYRNDSETLTA